MYSHTYEYSLRHTQMQRFIYQIVFCSNHACFPLSDQMSNTHYARSPHIHHAYNKVMKTKKKNNKQAKYAIFCLVMDFFALAFYSIMHITATATTSCSAQYREP